jgi:hypothetical protein
LEIPVAEQRIDPETGVIEEKAGSTSRWTPAGRAERVDPDTGFVEEQPASLDRYSGISYESAENAWGSSHGATGAGHPSRWGASRGQTSRLHAGAVRASLMNRMERWLWLSLERMSDDEILRVVEAQSPAETIAEILVATPEARATADDDWAELLLRGAEAKNRIAELVGGLLSSSEAAAILGISVPGVKQRVERHKLLAVPLPGGQWGFPALQFADGGRVRAGVPEVVKAGSGVDAWTVLSILVDDTPDGSGLLLEHLDDPAVLRDAVHRLQTYGEHVAG